MSDSTQQNNQNTDSSAGMGGGQTGEKQDWLDKGIEMAGKKAGVNVSDANADKAGDFANKEFQQKEGEQFIESVLYCC
ncbi:hypothetical protein BC835DRAFT_1298187 [Cytidiella melzeri]|nr:hypothetical protein BC835DRAFT_1298187 [Cytidiella melzeri]